MYEVKRSLGRHYVVSEGRPLGAAVLSHIRAYVFPLYTPEGIDVLEECPPDHPHQQGLMVGQDLLSGHNFWAPGHSGRPLNRQEMEHGRRVVTCVEETGVTIDLDLCWRTVDGQAVIDEQRTYRFECWDELNFVDVTSIWKASYGDVFVGRTKEGGVGMRVHARLQTEWGGAVRASNGNVTGERVFDTQADWVEVSGNVGPGEVGIVMMPHPSMRRIPWFSRDYGLHLYSPARHAAERIPFGESRTLRVAFAAYDRPRDGSKAKRAWETYRSRP